MRCITLIILLYFSLTVALEYQENVINVQGNAEKKVIPNQATLMLTIRSSHANSDSAVILLEPKLKNQSKIFDKYGLDKNTAKLKGLSIEKDWEYQDRTKVVKEYIAKRSYKITFSKIDKLSHFLSDSYLTSSAEFDDINFERTDAIKIKKELLSLATEDAYENAKILAKDNNMKILYATVVSNETPSDFSYENRVRINMRDFGKTGGIDDMLGGLLGGNRATLSRSIFEVDPGLIEIKNTVWITYKIKRVKK